MAPIQKDVHMDPHVRVVTKLFAALGAHDHQAMASCYHADAAFHDIAFDLHGRNPVAAMWHMICLGDIRVAVESVEAKVDSVRARVTDEYTLSSTGRRVRNHIESNFTFRDGLIHEHRDICDPREWARQALGGVKGLLAGQFRFLRQRKAHQQLGAFMKAHPEYGTGFPR